MRIHSLLLVLDSSLGRILAGTEALAIFCVASIMVRYVGRARLGYGSMAAGCALQDAAAVDSGWASVRHGLVDLLRIQQAFQHGATGRLAELLPGHPEQRLVMSGIGLVSATRPTSRMFSRCWPGVSGLGSLCFTG